MGGSMVRHIPNLISVARLVCFPILIFLAQSGRQNAFAWLLIAAFLSDAIDGYIARRAGVTSKLGAFLDSIADLSVQVAILFGVWSFYEPFVRANVPVFLTVLGLWAAALGLGVWRYGRVASFHTYASRVAAYTLAVFLAVLFLWGLLPWLFYLTVTVIVLSLVEGLVLIALIPRWTPDARGLYWVLRARRKEA